MLLPYAAILVGLHVFRSAWLALLLYHGLAVVWLARGRRIRCARFAPARLDALGVGSIVLASLAGPALAILWPAIAPDTPLAASLARFDLAGQSLLAFAIWHVAFNPWIEEALWRGVIAEPRAPTSPSDAAFAAYHLLAVAPFVKIAWLAVVFAVLLFTATLWRALARRKGGLFASACAHLAADASVFGWLLLAVGRA